MSSNCLEGGEELESQLKLERVIPHKTLLVISSTRRCKATKHDMQISRIQDATIKQKPSMLKRSSISGAVLITASCVLDEFILECSDFLSPCSHVEENQTERSSQHNIHQASTSLHIRLNCCYVAVHSTPTDFAIPGGIPK